MISSESINYSKYSLINEQMPNSSNDLEINEPINKHEEKENTDFNNNIAGNEKDNDKLLTLQEKQNEISSNELYGNKIENIHPKFLGSSFAFFYNSYGDPRITIGPDCKNILLNISFLYKFYLVYA